MKYFTIIYLFLLVFFCSNTAIAMDDVTYRLTYDTGTGFYTMAAKSEVAYTGNLARLSPSTQVTIVFPHTAGGFQIANFMDLQTSGTALNWSHTRLDAPTENPSKDYLYFSPNNATGYTPFDFPVNTYVDLFSFESGSGCLGDILLFDNINDPLNANTSLNSGNNFVILGGGANNKYVDNENPLSMCSTGGVIYYLEYDATTEVYTVSAESDVAYTGAMARLSPSTQVSVVMPQIAGGFQITNLTDLQSGATPLDWDFSQLNAPTENPNNDYFFFAPANATGYTTFDFPAATKVPLFSFKSGSGCLGDLLLFDNDIDPLNANLNINSDNNFVILGGGADNKYEENVQPTAGCGEVTYCLQYDESSETYTVSMQSSIPLTGPQARMSSSTQVSVVAPAIAGGFQVTNLMGLQTTTTSLAWSVSQLDAPTENTAADYLFFTIANANSYTPFDIPADTEIALFSFQTNSGCHTLNLFDNDADPLNASPNYNPDNSIVILGGGMQNLFAGMHCVTAEAECCQAQAPMITKD